jgi:autoinducer 2-degrading protein
MDTTTEDGRPAAFFVCVTVRVLPEHTDAFVAATRANAEAARREPNNIRFDVLRAVDDPTRFFFYEVYASEEGFREHQRTEHYLTWKDAVAPWMAEPRIGVKHVAVFPELSFPVR